MNNARRKEIDALRPRIEALFDAARAIAGEIDTISADEQDYRDSLPESMADGEKGDKADEAIAALEEVAQTLEDFAESGILDNFDTAKG